MLSMISHYQKGSLFFYSFGVMSMLNTMMQVQHQYKHYQLIMPKCLTFQNPRSKKKEGMFVFLVCPLILSLFVTKPFVADWTQSANCS